MNRTQLSLLSLVAVGATTLAASSAQATESARRTGLGGTALIEDSDDIYAFPQAAFGKKLYLEANYRPSAGLYGGAGSGSIFFGNDQEVFGIMTHRGDYNAVLFNTIAGPFDNANPFTSPNQAIDDFRVGLLKPPTPRALPGERAADVDETANVGGTTVSLNGTVVNAGEGAALPDLALAPVQLIDVLYARNNFGVRLSAGVGSTSQDTQISWGDGYQVASNAVVTNIVAGFRGQQGADRYDASVELGYARAHTETLDVAEGLIGNDVTSSTPSIGAAVRYTMPKSETLDFVATGNLHYGTESTTTMTNDIRYYWDDISSDDPNLEPLQELREEDKFGPVPKVKQEESESTFALYAAAGPRYKIANRAIVSADVGLGFVRTGLDPFVDSACTDDKDDRDICDGINAVDLSTDNTIRYGWMLPSVRVAGEFNVTERVTLRTGMRTVFTLSTEEIEGNAATSPADVSEADADPAPGVDDKSQLTTGQTYYWSAGLGLNYGELQFDAAFNTAFITNGPNFLSGANSGPMFGLVTVKYDFGTGSSNNNVTGTRAGYPAEELAAPAAAPSFAAPVNNGFNP
jgi:hypothetical protein